MIKKALVTGAGGFIGSHLVESLVKKGVNVRAFTHYNSHGFLGNLELLPKEILKEIEIISGDIQDPFGVNKAVAGCDTVFHLAALIAIPYSYKSPETYVNTNVKGTLNVLQACLDHNVAKMVHTSTSETYGTAQYTPIDEAHPLQGQSPYSASKIGADMMAMSYFRSFGLPVATIRPFNTFGPRQSARAIIPTIITQALTGDCVKLGSLEPIRDLTYVKDTAEGFIKIAESKKSVGELINIGNGQGISMGDLAQKIFTLMGKDIHVKLDEQRIRPGKSEVMNLLCDNKKAENLAGWAPRYSLSDGLKETIQWIEKNLDKYKPEVYNI